MKQPTFLLAGSVLAVMMATPALAVQGSKFAAHVRATGTNTHILHSGVADTAVVVEGENDCAPGDKFFPVVGQGGVCVKVNNQDAILRTTIRTANKKDLLIGVSLQNGIFTDTSVKGKNGSSEKAGADAGIMVWVDVDGETAEGEDARAYPGPVVFNRRIQELSATLGGVIESCEVHVEEDGEGGYDGSFVVADDCVVTDEEIGLILSTTSANHFNFVAPDLAPGDHKVTVWARAMASAAFLNGTYVVGDYADQAACETDGGVWDGAAGTCTFETSDNNARAWAVVDVGSLTVEEVRAINQDVEGAGIIVDMDAP